MKYALVLVLALAGCAAQGLNTQSACESVLVRGKWINDRCYVPHWSTPADKCTGEMIEDVCWAPEKSQLLNAL